MYIFQVYSTSAISSLLLLWLTCRRFLVSSWSPGSFNFSVCAFLWRCSGVWDGFSSVLSTCSEVAVILPFSFSFISDVCWTFLVLSSSTFSTKCYRKHNTINLLKKAVPTHKASNLNWKTQNKNLLSHNQHHLERHTVHVTVTDYTEYVVVLIPFVLCTPLGNQSQHSFFTSINELCKWQKSWTCWLLLTFLKGEGHFKKHTVTSKHWVSPHTELCLLSWRNFSQKMTDLASFSRSAKCIFLTYYPLHYLPCYHA